MTSSWRHNNIFLVSYTNLNSIQTTKKFGMIAYITASQDLRFSYLENMKWHRDDVIIVFFSIRLKKLPYPTYIIETLQPDSLF